MFNATTEEVCIDIVIIEDLIVEGPESFTVGLSTDDEDAVFVRQQIEDFIVDTTRKTQCRLSMTNSMSVYFVLQRLRYSLNSWSTLLRSLKVL